MVLNVGFFPYLQCEYRILSSKKLYVSTPLSVANKGALLIDSRTPSSELNNCSSPLEMLHVLLQSFLVCIPLGLFIFFYFVFRCKTSTKGLVSRGNQIAIRDFIRQYTGPAFKVQFAACTTTDMNGERVYRILCYRDYKSKFAENMKTEYEDVTNLTQARLYSNTELTIKLDGQYEIDNDDQIVKLRYKSLVQLFWPFLQSQ